MINERRVLRLPSFLPSSRRVLSTLAGLKLRAQPNIKQSVISLKIKSNGDDDGGGSGGSGDDDNNEDGVDEDDKDDDEEEEEDTFGPWLRVDLKIREEDHCRWEVKFAKCCAIKAICMKENVPLLTEY
ncbi:hypothetical protein PoB_007587100 [Plakobranchus ocellatus]|uniref:Uncharacterized protein n=1 Tax=Plakobranchus ocellatus TaxID=259542 RepID=A0AAV4DZV0_9GAST|nr:hypothetical protein PoB_007587100 [Plakobranchus ocellatus]